MAKEYIEKEAAIQWLEDMQIKHPRKADAFGVAKIHFKHLPAADVRENVRGRWKVEVNYQTGIETVSCPNCHIKHTFPIGPGVKVLFTNYCPNCGARMDGEDGDGDG